MKLKSLKLTNFEGIRSLEINADGKSLSIYGDNGTGKTTIADAQAWLLFDKDNAFTPNFLPKPRDGQGEELHNLDTVVEGTYILDDGTEITFRKVFAENWKKKRGSTEAVFSGHTLSYYIDGVPKKEAEYTAYLESVADIRQLMLLSMPQYFPEILDIKKRREMLLSLVKDIDDYDVITSSEALKPLQYLMLKPGCSAVWYSIEEFIEVSKATEKKANADLKEIPGRIDEAQRSLSGVTEKRLKEAKKELTALNAKKISLQLKKSAPSADLEQSLTADIAKIKAKIEQKRAEYAEECAKLNSGIMAQIEDINKRYAKQAEETSNLRSEHYAKLSEAGRLRNARNELLQQWQEINASQWNGDKICPACGQAIPEDKIAEAVAKFNEQKSIKLSNLSAEGKKCSKEIIAAVEADIEKLKSRIVCAEAEEKKLTAERDELRARIQQPTPFEQTKEYKDLTADMETTHTHLAALRDGQLDGNAELLTEIASVDMEISAISIEIAGYEADKRIQERIKELTEQEQAATEAYAKARQGLDLAEQFGRIKAELLTDKINENFKNVRFRLFKTQINGGIQDDCEVMALTSAGYIPYSTANNAARINAGLEIIKGFGKVWEQTMPVFVDNAESITQLGSEGLQVVRLIVSEQDKALRIEEE